MKQLSPEQILKDTHAFYNSKAWRNLSHQIRREQNNECQVCKAKGKYKRATIVHHIKEIKYYPELAYSRTFVDENGDTQRQLMAVCHECHEEIHEKRFLKISEKFVNDERW